jgi:hypothetical protein
MASAVCAVMAFAGTAYGGGAANTKVTVKGSSEIYGYVKSSKRKCMNDRKVTVFKRMGGDFVKVASDRASKQGDRYQWSIGNPGLQGKTIYARAGKIAGCKAGKSELYKVPS